MQFKTITALIAIIGTVAALPYPTFDSGVIERDFSDYVVTAREFADYDFVERDDEHQLFRRGLQITVLGVRTTSSRTEAEKLVMKEYKSKGNGKVYQQYSHCLVDCAKLPYCTYRFHNGNPNAFPPGPGGAIAVHK